MAAGALAEFGKANMPALAQFQPGGDQHTVNIYAGLPLELEQHVHRAGIVGAAAQNPSAAAENCACESLDQPRWLLYGDGLHLHRPGNAHRLYRVDSGIFSLTTVLSEPAASITYVQESNGP